MPNKGIKTHNKCDFCNYFVTSENLQYFVSFTILCLIKKETFNFLGADIDNFCKRNGKIYYSLSTNKLLCKTDEKKDKNSHNFAVI